MERLSEKRYTVLLLYTSETEVMQTIYQSMLRPMQRFLPRCHSAALALQVSAVVQAEEPSHLTARVRSSHKVT